MENKVVLVTGAAQGIGFATAKAFAETGASVALADRDEAMVNKAAEQLKTAGYKTLAIACDVSDDTQVKAMVTKTVKTFGKLDAAFNNAGIQNVLADAADQTIEDFDRVMGVNLRGVWSCMKYELQHMRKQGSGAIVNCSSIGGILGGPQRGTYHGAKHGVIGLTKSAALEYAAQGIRINSICPGIIHTPMVDKMMAGGQQDILDAMIETVPVKRLGHAEEIASAVLWLCSDMASLVVGHTLVVDGGYSIQ
ncbi:SDR family oxidoreductase [Chitinophaga sp.]|uniref:SDR family NAD(P)-dependent oxidoreductase n=1 Tax=Chitinophaga sp. TaxID=1869181 RepID=UPI0031D208AF